MNWWCTNALCIRLMKEARILSKQRNERGVSARSIRKVGERTLRGFKG